MKKLLICISTLLLITSCNNQSKKNNENTTNQNIEISKSTDRIVSLNGTLTEILVELGHKKEIIGVDVTSTYPEDLKNTTENLDHVFKLSVEKLISLKPTKVFALQKDLKPEVLEQLKNAGIEVITFEQTYTPEGIKNLIANVAQKLNNENFSEIQTNITTKLNEVKKLEKSPKVLFIYARANQMMVGGTGTPVEEVIKLAGGSNAVTEFSDYKPLTPEALIQANPDYILMFDKGLEAIGGVDGLLKVDGIAQTNAGKNKKIIRMDGLLLSGFGPRLAEAVVTLNSQFK